MQIGQVRCSGRAMLGGAWLAALLVAAPSARALTINASMDSTITGNAASAAIQSAIGSALSFYSIFTDPVSVSINFQLAPSNAGYLGGTYASYYVTSYAAYTASLLADANAQGNAVALTASNNLIYGNNAAQISATAPDLRALGGSATGYLTASGGIGGSFDGVILLNAALLDGFGGAGGYASLSVIQHEVNEVLGIGGAGSVLNAVQQNSLPTPPIYNGQSYIGPLDLYRYAAAGTPSLTTSGSATSYFSIDGGTTNIVAFNQNSGGDYGDWGAATCTNLVQQAFTCGGSTAALALNSPEVTALQAVGYDLPVPEPMSLSLLASGLVGLGLRRRRR